jgi:methyl-accepting chemotaxis protein
MVLALLVGALVRWALAHFVQRPLKEVGEQLDRVAGGDLTVRIEQQSGNEIGVLFAAATRMQDGLTRVIGAVRASSESISTASRQIAAGNLDLSSRTEQQAASLEQTAASMTELTETVKQNAENARQARSLTSNARDTTRSGRADVEAMVQTVNEVRADSEKVAEITGMIEGIAFQTNILALNAAVEAARAGEQGRGFAVVAGEVRSLAQRASGAAKEIKALIEASTTKVQLSAQQAAGVNASMERVSVAIERVSDIIGEISAASDEQSRNIEQVHQAINQIDQVTQQNAALVEESAAAAQSLQEQAAGMKGDVMFFKIATAPASVRSLAAV